MLSFIRSGSRIDTADIPSRSDELLLKMRRLALLVLSVPILVYGAIVGYFVVREPSFVYHPTHLNGRRMLTAPDSLRVEPVTLRSADGTRLSAWAMQALDQSAPWVLYYHGNAGNISYESLQEFYARWHGLGANVFAVDYRSYGTSEEKPLTEAAVYEDARAAYHWLRETWGVPAERIIIYGHSLGSGIATQIASELPAAGLIVEGAFTSVPDRAAELYPWLPVQRIARNRFDSIDKIARIAMPKLIMHAVDDSVIPISHGRALCAAASEPKSCLELPRGGHMDAFRENDEFWPSAARFVLRAIGASVPDSVRSQPAATP